MTWLLFSVIVLTLSSKIGCASMGPCFCIPVTFVLSSFLFHIQSFHVIQIKLCLSLSWGDASIAMPESEKAISTRTFCNRHHIAVETALTCTKHCKGIVTDPLWQIFRLLGSYCACSHFGYCACSHFGMRRHLIHIIEVIRRWAQYPLKKYFVCLGVFFLQLYFSAVISFGIWSHLKFTHLIVFFINCCVSSSYSADRSPNIFGH